VSFLSLVRCSASPPSGSAPCVPLFFFFWLRVPNKIFSRNENSSPFLDRSPHRHAAFPPSYSAQGSALSPLRGCSIWPTTKCSFSPRCAPPPFFLRANAIGVRREIVRFFSLSHSLGPGCFFFPLSIYGYGIPPPSPFSRQCSGSPSSSPFS